MAAEIFANDATATVTAGGTTAPAQGTVETWTLSGSTLPAVSSTAVPPTQCYICDPDAESEKMLVTNISGPTATVTRGADGTTPVTHAAGFTVRNTVTRASLEGLVQQSGGALLSGLAPQSVALTDAATIAVDASLGNYLTVTLGGNRTLGTPSNPLAGQKVVIAVTQPASGGPYTLAYNSSWNWGAGGPPVLSTAAGKTDFLGFAYSAALSQWCGTAYALGY